MTSGILYVVATPIGNLADFSPRAREILNSVDLIAAEDTRHTRRLLSHFGIKTRLFALHEHNEKAASAELIRLMLDGKSVALVSDAGTPLLSDPGFELVAEAHQSALRCPPCPVRVRWLLHSRPAASPRTDSASKGFCQPVVPLDRRGLRNCAPRIEHWFFTNQYIA